MDFIKEKAFLIPIYSIFAQKDIFAPVQQRVLILLSVGHQFDKEWVANLLVTKFPSNLKRDTNLFDKRTMGGYIAIQSLPQRGQHHQEEDQDLSDRGTKPDLLEKKAASSEDSK